MKLSEAIRAGAKLHPQGFKGYITTTDGTICTCVIGSAYHALTGNLPPSDNAAITVNGKIKVIEFVETVVMGATGITQADNTVMPYDTYYPAGPERGIAAIVAHPILEIATRLNDRYRWPREKIADWLEGQGY